MEAGSDTLAMRNNLNAPVLWFGMYTVNILLLISIILGTSFFIGLWSVEKNHLYQSQIQHG